jgi:serine protease Do
MGIVSAVARPRDSNLSPVYIQTDAAVNPGSSGGALVDIHGRLIGMTSFILTEGGGSEGLGFALPSSMVYLIYRELKNNGRFQVGDIGLRVQTVTSTMASGLRLPRKAGVIVSDVIPGSSADSSGIRVQDILLSLDGIPLEGSAQYATSFYTKRVGDRVDLAVLRGSRSFTTTVLVQQGGDDPEESLEQLDMQKSIVTPLGIVAVTLSDRSRSAVSGLRSKSGVLVAGKVAHSDARTGLALWDLIRSVNGTNVETVEDVRSLLQDCKSGEAFVVQVERHGRFRYLSFEID